MNKEELLPKIKQFAPMIVIGVLLVAAIIYISIAKSGNDHLTASGTIETTQIDISSEIGGLVAEVVVEEGDEVQKGDVLIVFDDELLQVQEKQAIAALTQAEAAYKQTTATSQVEITSAQQALDDLYDTESVAYTEAEQNVADLLEAVDDAETRLNNLLTGSKQSDIDQAFANMILARDQLEEAQEDFDKWSNKQENNLTRARLLSALGASQDQYDDAVTLYNNLTGAVNEIDLAQAEADLANAQAALEKAEEDLANLTEGPDPDALELANARLAAAYSGLETAAALVDVAEANLATIEVQLEKLTIEAPLDSIVLFRSVEPGEVVQPISPLMTLAKVDDLTITVYILEDRYGEVSLGDTATVKVDSFPDETFKAKVIRIADEAEYTPRNVQTAEGRKSTVFAVKLVVEDPHNKLKPGMPADVYFAE